YMGIYANVGAAATQFYLTRVPSAAAHHTLVLNLFDIGDASVGSIGDLTIVPPSDSNISGTFANCTATSQSSSGGTGYAVNTPTSPWGDNNALPGCQIQGVNNGSGTWNGQWTTVTVPIPSGYTCNDSDPNGCWVKINYHFTGGLADTTSWN